MNRQIVVCGTLVGLLAMCAAFPSVVVRAEDASCKDTFNPQLFCEQLVHTQKAFRVEGGFEVRTNYCPGLTSASMILFQDHGKDLFRVQCEIHCGFDAAHIKVKFAKLMEDTAWSSDTDAFLREHDACSSNHDYSKVIEAYQKQTGEDFTAN